MLYTVGKISLYDALISKGYAAKGKSGSVWLTFVEAKKQAALFSHSHNVYGVEASWENDTVTLPGMDFHVLTRNGKLVALDQKTGEAY